ncbi:MAG: serine/threonine protein kinase, partial [Chloroflexi bacterium]|nr:serine/threonine protein kinase [Chloroflexota bacterium]
MSGELTGQQLGPFTIDELISSNPLIDTYSGYDADPEQRVVVKIVKREPAPEDDLLLEFRREARAIAGLRHPNIARVFDFGETRAGRYVVSREIDGVPLSEALAEAAATGQTFSLDDVAFIVRQVAAALHEAHRQGVMHRALTPERILLTRSAQAIVTDFGLALLAGDGGAEDPLGAREYSAPEMQTGAHSATPAADVYSLAVIAYELLTGQRPYSLDSDLDRALRDRADTAPDPRIFRPSLPRAVTPVLQKGLATAPGERFESAMAFASALERALDGDAVVAPERKPAPEVIPPPTRPPARKRRSPVTLARVVVVAVVLLLFAGAGAMLLQAIGLISLPFGPRLASREPEAEVAAEPSPPPTSEPTNT